MPYFKVPIETGQRYWTVAENRMSCMN